MASTTHLIDKYTHYQSIGHGVFTVTLSTYVKCTLIGKRLPIRRTDDRWRIFWDHHFIYGVKRCLPFKAKIDHDWVLEESPGGYYHYHGMLAVDSAHKHRLWTPDGLNRQLSRRLSSFSKRGKYRPFRVNEYLIEPVVSIEAWAMYSTKETLPYAYT